MHNLPKFYMMIGLPASMKSSFIERNKINNDVIVSSDALREELFGDVNDQTHNNEVFNEMYKRTRQGLSSNHNVWYDATNLSRKKRINLLKELPSCQKIAIVMATPFEVCKLFNNKRDRTVPYYVMKRMYKSFEPPHYDEGFDKILVNSWRHEGWKPADEILAENIKCPHDNPYHSLSCGKHCLAAEEIAIDYFSEHNNYSDYDKEIVIAAARYHDMSKYKCKTWENRKGESSDWAHYYNHENVSAYDYLCGQRYCGKEEIEVANLIANHMIFFNNDNAIKARKKIYNENFWRNLELLHLFDKEAH